MNHNPQSSAVARLLGPAAVGALVFSIILLAPNFSRTKYNSLWLAEGQAAPRPATWLWLDAVHVKEAGKPVALRGYLWNAWAGDHTFGVVSDGGLEIEMNGQLAYRRPAKGAMMTEAIRVNLPAGAIPIAIKYQTADPITPGYEVSLRQAGRLIAPWRLYSDDPTPQLVARQRWAWIGLYLGVGLLAASGVLGATATLRSLTLPRRDLLTAGAITALAIAARLIVALERYQTAPEYYAMVGVWDNFVGLGRSLLNGRIALPGSYYQQGTIVYSALAQIALGPGILPQYILNAVLGGLACGLVLGATWAMFGRTAGLAAGALTALFAPLIHYQTTLQIVVPATLASSMAVAMGAWLLRRPGWKPGAAFGVAVGVGFLARGTLMGMAVGGPVAGLLSPIAMSRRRRLLLSAVPILSLIVTLLPLTIANFSVGEYSFSSSGQAVAFFRANHRDTFGNNEYMTDRERLARLRSGGEENFNRETWRDIRADPGHWLQQLAHKAGMFWSGHDYSDRQIDFYSTGLARSRALSLLWLGATFNWTLLAAFAAFGALFAWREKSHRPGIACLASLIAGFMLFTVVFSPTGRMRAPILPALFPLTALGLVSAVGAIREIRAAWRPAAIAASVAAAALLAAHYLETRLPLPTVVSKLPATLVETNVDFDSKVRLIGFDAFDSNFKSEGYLEVTFYWEALQPLDADDTLFIHLLDPSLVRAGGIDRPLGSANLPAYPPRQWKPGQIVRQTYFAQLPKIEGEAVPLRIIVGLYGGDGQRLPITASNVEVLDGTAAFISGVSLLPLQTSPLPLLPHLMQVIAGDEVMITAANLPEDDTLAPGATTLDVVLNWQATAHPSRRYNVFFHLMDEGGNLVTQFDGPPAAEFPTDTWPPASQWQGSYQIPLPPNLPPGEYQLVMGLYDIGNLERLPLSSAGDALLAEQRVLVAKVRVGP